MRGGDGGGDGTDNNNTCHVKLWEWTMNECPMQTETGHWWKHSYTHQSCRVSQVQ